MGRFETMLVALALTCFFGNSAATTSSYFSRSWTLEEGSSKSLQPATLFIADEQIYSAGVCETTVPNKEKQCNVTVTVQPSKPDQICNNIKIFASKGRELFFNGFFQLIPFNKNHIAVAWYDNTKKSENGDKKSNFKFNILNTATCKSFHLDFPVDKVAYGFFPAFVFYQNQIDIILNSKATCNGASKCKLTYDLDGKRIGGVQAYEAAFSQYASPVSAAAPEKGFFMLSKDLSSLTVLKIENNGNSKVLLTVNFEQNSAEPLVVFSNAHELYTVCLMPVTGSGNPTKIDCWQFDQSGNIKINTSIKLEESAAWIVVRSLTNGFLLGTSTCNKPKSTANENRNFRVFKVRENGQIAKKVEVEGPEFQCQNKDSGLEVRLTENENNQYCFDFSYLSSSTNLTFSRFCRSEY